MRRAERRVQSFRRFRRSRPAFPMAVRRDEERPGRRLPRRPAGIETPLGPRVARTGDVRPGGGRIEAEVSQGREGGESRGLRPPPGGRDEAESRGWHVDRSTCKAANPGRAGPAACTGGPQHLCTLPLSWDGACSTRLSRWSRSRGAEWARSPRPPWAPRWRATSAVANETSVRGAASIDATRSVGSRGSCTSRCAMLGA